MAESLNGYLTRLSSEYYLKNNSTEIANIDRSLNNLFTNLDNELGILINRRFVFGSYDRDTILPRKYDNKSDIDIMVVFNHTEYERTPETYRAWLKNFADKYYKDRYGSEVLKSFPTVTIKLNNIHFDLVPAKEEIFLNLFASIYIPSSTGWQTTDPNDVKVTLTRANTQYNSIVRPIIRLLKAWNANNNYPYDSYKLELKITGMNFYNDTIETGFYYAINQLSDFDLSTQAAKDKLSSLKYNIAQARLKLDTNDINQAKHWLHRVLPES